jgi:hypothetical protein
MSQKVMLCGILKEEGWLYYIDKDGDIAKVKAHRTGRPKGARNK